MAFRKRNFGVRANPSVIAPGSATAAADSTAPSSATTTTTTTTTADATESQPSQSTTATTSSQPSHPTTSASSTTSATTPTGTPALDSILSRPPGQPLGSATLLLERGATDYAGALLRVFAAEGLMRGEVLHVVGAGRDWVRGLPGMVNDAAPRRARDKDGGGREMKIAWRYERFGGAEREADSTGHAFDFTKRFELPAAARVHHHALGADAAASPFDAPLRALAQALAASPDAVHRVVVPGLLSPAAYPPRAAEPAHLLPFLHGLRGLLRRHARRATAALSLSLALHPRSAALVRWAEHLADAVLELAPFPHRLGPARAFAGVAASPTSDEPQGLLRVHKLAVLERGGGAPGLGLGEDWAFVLGRKRFDVVRYTLPVEDEDEASESGGGMDF